MEATPWPRSWIRGELIGAGAFGMVNLALNQETGELLAVKSIECTERTTSEKRSMQNEVEILSSLDSPHVIKCLGSSQSVEGGTTFQNLFMEHMAGGSLADLMKKFGGRFDEALVRKFTRSILKGLRYLHGRGIVHCDIKGKNVLVGSSGVKLADFGSARRIHEAEEFDGNLRGTPLWMAPEVVDLAEQGPESDVWSLGCTVVEMATGGSPWGQLACGGANAFVALFHIHRSERVPDLPGCLSAEAHDFLRKCFQRDPRARPSADELLRHPFVAEKFSREASSPTSVLDSGGFKYESSEEVSVPILRSPLFATAASSDAGCNSPFPEPAEWIVVRSPKSCASEVSFEERRWEWLGTALEVGCSAREAVQEKQGMEMDEAEDGFDGKGGRCEPVNSEKGLRECGCSAGDAVNVEPKASRSFGTIRTSEPESTSTSSSTGSKRRSNFRSKSSAGRIGLRRGLTRTRARVQKEVWRKRFKCVIAGLLRRSRVRVCSYFRDGSSRLVHFFRNRLYRDRRDHLEPSLEESSQSESLQSHSQSERSYTAASNCCDDVNSIKFKKKVLMLSLVFECSGSSG